MGRQDAQRFRYVMLLVVVAAAVIGYHVFIYVPAARNALHSRNQRTLAAMAEGIEEELRNLPYVIRSALAKDGQGLCDPRTFFEKKSMKAFSTESAIPAPCRADARNVDVVQHIHPSGRYLTLAACTPADSSASIDVSDMACATKHSAQHAKKAALVVKVDLSALLAPFVVDDTFDSILVVSKGHAPAEDRFLMTSRGAEGIPLTAEGLRRTLANGLPPSSPDSHHSGQPGQLLVGPSAYWTYGRPLLYADLNLELFALVHEGTLDAQTDFLPLSAVLMALSMVLFLVLILPYLKVVLVGVREPLRRVDVRVLAWSGVGCAAAVTLLALDVTLVTSMRAALHERLRREADAAADTITKTLERGIDQLPRGSLRTSTEDSCTAPALGAPGGFALSTVLTIDGQQVFKARPTEATGTNRPDHLPLLDVHDRDYVTRVRNGDENGPYGSALDFASVHSRSERSVLALISSKFVHGGEQFIGQLAIDLSSLLQIKRGAGLEAAVVDKAGAVVSHSRSERSGTENVLRETNSGSGLRQALAAGRDATVVATYHGAPRTFEVRQLRNTPWLVLLIADLGLAHAVNAEIVGRSLTHLATLLAILAVLGAGLLRLIGHSWMWPQYAPASGYLRAIVALTCMSVCFGLAVPYVSLGEHTPFWTALFQILGPVVAFAVLRTSRTLHARPRFESHPAWHMGCALALLIQMAAIPSLVLFLHSANTVRSIWDAQSHDVVGAAPHSAARAEPVASLVPTTFPFVADLQAAAPYATAVPADLGVAWNMLPWHAYRYPLRDYGNPDNTRRKFHHTIAVWLMALVLLALFATLVALPAVRVFGATTPPRRGAAHPLGQRRLLFLGGTQPSDVESAREVREALHPRIDLHERVGDRLEHADVLVLTELQAALWHPETRRSVLDFLRRVTRKHPHLRIEIYSQVNPLDLVQSQRRNALRAHQQNLGAGIAKPPATNLPVDAPPDVREWSNLLALFTVVEGSQQPTPDLETRLSEPVEGATLTPEQIATLVQETGWHARLRRVAELVARSIAGSAASTDDIVDLVRAHAVIEHRYIFSSYSGDQKLVLAYVAQEGFANPTAWDDVLDLEALGVLVRDPELRIVSQSFARFVCKELVLDDVTRLEQPEPSRWTHVRTLAIGSLVLCGAALTWLAPDLGTSIFAALTPAIAGAGAFVKVFGSSDMRLG